MAHIAKLQQWAKSRAVIIPKAIWKELGWHVGDSMMITSQNGAVVVQPVRLPQAPTVTPSSGDEVGVE